MRNRGLNARLGGNDTALSRGRPERFRPVHRVRADQGTTIATGVSQWNDLSGNAKHLTQATGSLQPTLVASAQNGKPCVRGDGTDDIMSTASYNPVGNGAYTLCYSGKLTAAANKIFMELGTGSLGNGVYLGTIAASARTVTHPGAVDHAGTAISSNPEFWFARRAAASAPTLQVNGADISLSNSGNTAMTDPGASSKISLFASSFPVNFAAADTYEAVVYARDLSDSERARHTNYSRAYLGV